MAQGAALRADEVSDESLVIRAGRGDRAAASALVLRHSARIFSASWRMLADRAEAEDATQEAFLKLWSRAPAWRAGKASVKTWLYRVAMNACIDRLRRRRREAPLAQDYDAADAAPAADISLMEAERARAVATALAALPERQRCAIALCHYEELTNIEAAAAMGISVDALESLLARGRRALRAALADLRAKTEGTDHDRAAV